MGALPLHQEAEVEVAREAGRADPFLAIKLAKGNIA
jgi:hypothetical protein